MDPFQHFLDAQAPTFDSALAELRVGQKRTHWIWFIFPQLAGLGSSPRSQRYALRSLAEAETYLAHPILGPRLATCAEALLTHHEMTAASILGDANAMKLRSSMTLFATAPNGTSIFHDVLTRYFDGVADPQTLILLNP